MTIFSDRASAKIQHAISAYRTCLRTSDGSTVSNRSLISKILFPAFKGTLDEFDADWRRREGDEQPLLREMGHVRIDVRFTQPSADIFKGFLCSKTFRPDNIGYLHNLLNWRTDLVNGGALDDNVNAICSALRFIHIRERNKLKKKLKRSKLYRFNREISPIGKFCALCDKLTKLHHALSTRSDRDIRLEIDELRRHSSRYCKDHAPNGRLHEDAADRAEQAYESIVSAIISETIRDDEFRLRFVPDDSALYLGPNKANNWREPQQDSAAEFAYLANVRHIAQKVMKRDAAGAMAMAIDQLIQEGESKSAILLKLGISETIFMRKCDLAIARLKHKGMTDPQIYRRIGKSKSDWSDKKMSIGCFDFSPDRNPLLSWWPYNDLPRGNIVSLDTNAQRPWKHAASEYDDKNLEGKTVFRHARRPDPLAFMLF